MPSFDDMLAQLLEESEEVLGDLADIVSRGRMQADDLSPPVLEVLAKYDLIAFLVQRQPKRPVRTWVYPSPLGLKTFAILEREAERVEPKPVVTRRRRGDTGVSR